MFTEELIKMLVVNIVCFVLFPIMAIYRSSLYKENEKNELGLTRLDSSAIRGIAAIFIVFAHLLSAAQETGLQNMGPAAVYKWGGGLGVCVFFFVSGYGLWASYREKAVDMSYIKNRLKGIVPTYCIIRVIAIVLLGKYQLGLNYTIKYFLSIEESVWFVVEIVLIYLLFYVACNISKKYAILQMTLYLFLMSLLFLLLGFEARWYNANLVFVIGMLLAEYKKIINHYLTKSKFSYVFSFGVFLCIFAFSAIVFTILRGSILADVLKLLAGACFGICLYLLVIKLKFASPILKYIGDNSLQMYLLHLIVLEFVRDVLKFEHFTLFIVSLIVSIIVLFGYCEIEKRLQKGVRT